MIMVKSQKKQKEDATKESEDVSSLAVKYMLDRNCFTIIKTPFKNAETTQ